MRTSAGLLLALVACAGGDDGAPTNGDDFPRACDQSTVDGDCGLFTGAGWTAGDVQESCAAGELLPECPPNAVGTCTLDPGEFETVTSFYGTFWNGATAAQSCAESGGSFAEP